MHVDPSCSYITRNWDSTGLGLWIPMNIPRPTLSSPCPFSLTSYLHSSSLPCSLQTYLYSHSPLPPTPPIFPPSTLPWWSPPPMPPPQFFSTREWLPPLTPMTESLLPIPTSLRPTGLKMRKCPPAPYWVSCSQECLWIPVADLRWWERKMKWRLSQVGLTIIESDALDYWANDAQDNWEWCSILDCWFLASSFLWRNNFTNGTRKTVLSVRDYKEVEDKMRKIIIKKMLFVWK